MLLLVFDASCEPPEVVHAPWCRSFTIAGVAGCRFDPDAGRPDILRVAANTMLRANTGRRRSSIATPFNSIRPQVMFGSSSPKPLSRPGTSQPRLTSTFVRRTCSPTTSPSTSRQAIFCSWPAASKTQKGGGQKVLAKDARSVEAQILVANAHAGLKDLDTAVAQIEDALTIDPDRGSTYWSALGALELSRGRREAAERTPS